MRYRTRLAAAEYLTGSGLETTAQGLADHASRGKGPKYGIVNGRAVYTDVDLDAWIAEQLARPVVRRKERAAARAGV